MNILKAITKDIWINKNMEIKKKVHIVGTHGVPAKYGGFETLADFLCQYLGSDFDLTVYCNSHKYENKQKKYFGASLKYIRLDASGFKGIFYDLITYFHSLLKADIILYLSPVGSGFMTPLKFIFRKKVIVNHGGLNEWEREKLSTIQKRWAKFNHRVAAKFADINIADNILYQESLNLNFKAKSKVIRYGGDHVNKISINDFRFKRKYPFVNEKYAISVSRAQLDNNLHIVLDAFENFDNYKLVLVSNWEISKYGRDLKEKYLDRPNMVLLDAIYDKEELDYLRGNSHIYIHSHSRCGTAPSLVEAMNLSKAVISYDVPTNRETTYHKAIFFKNSDHLRNILKSLNSNDIFELEQNMQKLAETNYTWGQISLQYKQLLNEI